VLRRGFAVRRYTNALGWISSISAEARLDGLRVHSGVSPLSRDVAWVLLSRAAMRDAMMETTRVMLLQELAFATADAGVDEFDAQLD
jgi:hypothetical protein